MGFAKSVKTSNFLKYYFHLIIALVLGVTVFFGISPVMGLTHYGVAVLAITIPTIYLWLFVNTHWVSLLFLGLLTMTGIMSPNQVWASSLGHFSIMLVLTFSLISECLNEHGVIEQVANWFITRKFVQGRPYAFIGMFFGANLVIGMFMQNLALAVIFVTLTVKICDRLGLKKGDSLYNCLMLGTFWGNGVLSIASPIAKTLPNILIGLVYANFGVQISYATWLIIGIPFTTLMFGVIMLCIRIANPDTSVLKDAQLINQLEGQTKLSLKGKISSISMIVLVLMIVLPELLLLANILTSVATYLVALGPTVPAIIAVIMLAVIQVPDKDGPSPVLDFTTCITKVPFTLLLFVAAVVVMGTPLASDQTGIITWIKNILTPITYALPPIGLFVILIVMAVVVTNFISNTVALTVFVSLGSAIFANHVINPIVFAIVVTFATSMTCLTPSSTITAPLYYGPKHLKVSNILLINLVFLTFATLVLFAITPLVTFVL